MEAKNDYNARMDVLNKRQLNYADHKTRVEPLYKGRTNALAPITVAPAPPPPPAKLSRLEWLIAVFPLRRRAPGTGPAQGPLT